MSRTAKQSGIGHTSHTVEGTSCRACIHDANRPEAFHVSYDHASYGSPVADCDLCNTEVISGRRYDPNYGGGPVLRDQNR